MREPTLAEEITIPNTPIRKIPASKSKIQHKKYYTGGEEYVDWQDNVPENKLTVAERFKVVFLHCECNVTCLDTNRRR